MSRPLTEEQKAEKREYLRAYRASNIEKIAEVKRKHYEANREKLAEANRKYRAANSERLAKMRRERILANPDKIAEQKSKHYASNRGYYIAKRREYYVANKDKIAVRGREYCRARRKTSPLYVLKLRVRCRAAEAFRENGFKKSSKTAELLGCDWETLSAHIESQFSKGMNWKNRHLWHVDHIIPLATAKTEAEIVTLCHYKNLQPLWAADNLRKGNKIHNPPSK